MAIEWHRPYKKILFFFIIDMEMRKQPRNGQPVDMVR